MKRLLLILFLLSVIPAAGIAQELDDELEEIASQLREAQSQKRLLQQRLQLTDERIKLLTEVRKLVLSLGNLEEQIEEAEAKDDARKAERLIAQLEDAEINVELAHTKLELLERRGGVLDLLADLWEPELKSLNDEAESLLKMTDAVKRLIDRLFKARRDGPESEVDELEQELEAAAETFDRRLEILQLKVELHWAREEGDGEAVRELESELKELGGDRDVEPREKPSKAEARNRPAPMKLSAEEIVAAGKLDFQKHIVPLLNNSCSECHGKDTAEGDLNLAALVETRPLVINRTHWVNVIQQLKVRSMPPADAEHPAEADRRTMVAWLTNEIDNFDYATVRQPGYEQARRLTHDEYNNTIRDLTGIDIRPADRFPADLTATSGFENSANSLFLQPITLERYIGAAESIAAAAWPENPRSVEQRAAWQLLVGDVSDLRAEDAVETVLRSFGRRAYRRPIEAEEVASLASHYERRLGRGASPREALRDVLQVMLVSPSFLIRTERDGSKVGQPFRISEWELASRLSYFLWASMPDAELIQLAEAGQLSKPDVLRTTVERMLRDPKANTLGSIFASQWLGFTDLGRVRPGQIDNPWATDSLIAAMKDESAMLFNSIVRNNAPLDRLIDADYTFVNEELAKHYQMSGVRGSQMRQVSLQSSPRRGILGHGSILAVTSFPERTSPVIRGNWILSELLGTPPPPPPPNVSEFDEEVSENRKLTQRQKLELHRQKPNCYSCHSQIDPLGFALEEFEWFGRHRPTSRGKPVDTTGQLPDGQPFKGLTGLTQALLRDRIDDLTTQVCRKMLSYALGRQLEYYDEATVRELVAEMQTHERRIPALIHAIVRSDTFQMKQTEADSQERH
ncbi:MAG: DUF1592 domain-containing protein [Planctomycetales bacterium]|jgi:mono/diheme cytochrome c family protein